MRIYYAHSLQIYGTQREADEIHQIQAAFPGFEVINPNGSVDESQGSDSAMAQCILLIASADVLVFSALADYWIGKGVGTEIGSAEELGMPVYFLSDGRFYEDFELDSGCGWNWRYYSRVSVREPKGWFRRLLGRLWG